MKKYLRPLVALVLLLAAVEAGIAQAAPAPNRVSAAQAAADPFSGTDTFCRKHTPPPGTRNSSSPGVTPSSITIADMSASKESLDRLGVNQIDYHQAFQAFWDEVNKCGGINGRKIILKKDNWNIIAPDQPAHQQALCLKATEDHKAFLVNELGMSTTVARCVAVLHKSIYVTREGQSSDDFADAKGRIVSIYPAGDKLAAGFIADGTRENLFKGKTIGILGAEVAANPTAVAEQRAQYFDELKKRGFDVADFEIIPCTGSTCTAGIPGAISRMKAKGVDFILMTHYVSVTTAGPIWKEIGNQNLKAPVYGPYQLAVYSDAAIQSVVRGAGSDGATTAARQGWYGWDFVDVPNAWRSGDGKETALARMCTATLAKALNQRQYQFNEQDNSTGFWFSAGNACVQVRDVARAIWSLGNNVTTERMVAAMRAQTDTNRTLSGPDFRTKKWFMERDVAPASVSVGKFNYPCPQPRSLNGVGCFLPVDRPARVRTIKY